MFLLFVGSWLQTPRWYNYRKSVEPLFAYSLSRGSCKTLHTRINNECPRRYVHRRETQRIKHTKGHLSLSCFGCKKVSSFQVTKTSANKRLFIICLRTLIGVCGCKGSEIFWIEQEKSPWRAIFLCRV